MRRRSLLVAVATAGALMLAACGSGFEDDPAPGGEDTTGGTQTEGGAEGAALSMLIGSSGDAETAAVNAAAAAWAQASGNTAEVVVASDLNQQLSQGFAGGSPADVFYLSTDVLAGYAANGSLHPYGDQLAQKDDFYPALVDNFTYGGQFYCAPKDFSTLALLINNDAWEAAGLTDADIPTTWEELKSVATTLTTDSQVGLAFGPEYQRIGVFMAQGGGGLFNPEQTEAIANSAGSVTGLEFVQELFDAGVAAYSSDIGAGWGGEAFGKESAAMVIEGNWITGAMTNDFPDVDYRAVELPAGPAGQGTLQFTNCWGIAADSPNIEAAVDLVEFLTSTDQQLEFSRAFGVMPSVQSAADQWKSENPEMAAFLDGADYAQGMPTLVGASDVVADLNAQLEGLKSTSPQVILDSVQANLEAVLNQ